MMLSNQTQTPTDDMMECYRVNVAGTLRVTQRLLPLLEKAVQAGGGAVCLNMSSDLGSLSNNCPGNKIGQSWKGSELLSHVRPACGLAMWQLCIAERKQGPLDVTQASRRGVRRPTAAARPAVVHQSAGESDATCRINETWCCPPRVAEHWPPPSRFVCVRVMPDGVHSLVGMQAALNMLTRTLASDVDGVTFVAVSPGWVATDMGSKGGRVPPLTTEQSCSRPVCVYTPATKHLHAPRPVLAVRRGPAID